MTKKDYSIDVNELATRLRTPEIIARISRDAENAIVSVLFAQALLAADQWTSNQLTVEEQTFLRQLLEILKQEKSFRLREAKQRIDTIKRRGFGGRKRLFLIAFLGLK